MAHKRRGTHRHRRRGGDSGRRLRPGYDSERLQLLVNEFTSKPWRTIDEVEYATAQWVDWFNHRRLYEYCGDIPPVQMEAAYYAHHHRPAAG